VELPGVEPMIANLVELETLARVVARDQSGTRYVSLRWHRKHWELKVTLTPARWKRDLARAAGFTDAVSRSITVRAKTLAEVFAQAEEWRP
jgi:hypothetical protein